MALPLSRNTTYTANAQVKSVDLNAMQDMIIGGRHGQLKLMIPAYAFVGFNGSNAIGGYWDGSGVWWDAASSEVMAPVLLPVGRRIVDVTWWYTPSDGVNTGNLQPRLKRIDMATGTVTTIASGVSDNTGTVIESQTASAINHVMLDANFYWVGFDMGSIGGRIYGARIVHDCGP